MNNKIIIPIVLVVICITSILIYNKIESIRNSNDLLSNKYETITISETELLAIDSNMTYGSIIKELGKTKDVGSSTYVAIYMVNDGYLYLSFNSYADNCKYNGRELLNKVIPFTEQIDIKGTITSLYENNDSVTIMVESNLGDDPIYDKASVTVNDETIIYKEGFSNALFGYNILNIGDQVEITFTGEVLESYPIMATAKKIKVLQDNTFSER